MAFTFMPVVNHFFVFPCLKPIVALFNKICPPREADKPFGAIYVNDSLIDESVEISLEMAKKEIVRVAEIVTSMFDGVKMAFETKDEKVVHNLCQEDSRLIFFTEQLSPSLQKYHRRNLKKGF